MEVIRLSLHRPYACIKEEEPIVHLVILAGAAGIADFIMLGVVLVDEVLHDTTGFKEADGMTVGEGVCEGGDAAVRVYGEEPRFFLGTLLDVDFVSFVREAEKRSA